MLEDGTYSFSLVALHVAPCREQWTPLLGEHETPALVYEVVRVIEGEAESVYEGRIIEPESGEMIHSQPYRSTVLEPVAAWWSRETETDPPPELTPQENGGQCNHNPQRRRR